MTSTSTLLHNLPSSTVRRVVVSEMHNNVYLITSKRTGSQVLIDAADDADAIMALIASASGDSAAAPAVKLIATTHQHWDHVRALAAMVELTDAPTAAGADDAAGIAAESTVETHRLLGHNELLVVDDIELATVHLRGHTPGSIAYVLQEAGVPTVIFTGDSLFPGGVGATGDDPIRFASLIGDVEARVFVRFNDDTIVLPGHGDATVIGTERPQLPAWRTRGW
jgi:glyoxylase-like metal-dependent hydrolase (beta-lactamase superfamily II)